jgi:hypothetical protein
MWPSLLLETYGSPMVGYTGRRRSKGSTSAYRRWVAGQGVIEFYGVAKPVRCRWLVATTTLGKRLGYFVIIRLTGGGGAAAGEMTNVSHVFQPVGRSEPANSA